MERYHNFEKIQYLLPWAKSCLYCHGLQLYHWLKHFFFVIDKVCTISAKAGNYTCKTKNEEKSMYSQRLLSQIWLWDMQLRTGCSQRHKIPSNMYHETLPIRSKLHCWFIKIQGVALRLQLSNEIFWKMGRCGWNSMKSCPVFYTPLPSQVSYKVFLWEK